MFIEPSVFGKKRGWIEVICGSMFSGKTEELIRRLKRARIANLKTEIFKPAMDNRYHELNVVSHDSNFIISQPVSNAKTILLMAENILLILLSANPSLAELQHQAKNPNATKQRYLTPSENSDGATPWFFKR